LTFNFKRYPYLFLISSIIVVLDQASKWLVKLYIPLGTYSTLKAIPVIQPFCYLVHIQNQGAAWGILNKHSFGLGILGCIAIISIIGFHKILIENGIVYLQICFGLICGGIMGNLIDRLTQGAVIDFIDIHLPGYRWPAFNIADCGISIGVTAYIIFNMWTSGRTSNRR
jgi:signal peptidase II